MGICYWKAHHSLADGISVMCLSLSMSSEYDRSYFVRSPDATFLQILMLRLSVPLTIPLILYNALTYKQDTNIFTKNKGKINGIMNCNSSNELVFPEIKILCKKLGITINDLVSSSISASLKQVFIENGDKND